MVLNLIDCKEKLHNELARMSSPHVKFCTSTLELQSVTQAEQLSDSDNDTMANATESLWPTQNLDMGMCFFRPDDPKLLGTDGMKGIMVFDSKLFDRDTAVMIFECFKNLLEIAVENSHTVVWDLPMLMQSEEHRLLG